MKLEERSRSGLAPLPVKVEVGERSSSRELPLLRFMLQFYSLHMRGCHVFVSLLSPSQGTSEITTIKAYRNHIAKRALLFSARSVGLGIQLSI